MRCECEYCGRRVPLNGSVYVNGRWFHGTCVQQLSPEVWRDEVAMYMAMPHPQDPDYDQKMESFRKTYSVGS